MDHQVGPQAPELSEGASNLSSTVQSPAHCTGPQVYILPRTMHNWPYPPKRSAIYAEVEAESLRWLHALLPMPRSLFTKAGIGLLCGAAFPHASQETMCSIMKMMILTWIVDDHTDMCKTHSAANIFCDASMDAILHPEKVRPAGEPVIGEIARQFWERASANMSQPSKDRFVNAWRAFLNSVVLQTERRETKQSICSVDEYLMERRDNLACRPVFALLGSSMGPDVPAHILDHPTIVALENAAADMLGLSNDMCSYWKETQSGSADYNVITLLMRHTENTDVSGALQWISDTHDELVARFLELRGEVFEKVKFPSYGGIIDRQIEAYVDALGQCIRGHDDWSFACGRYFGDVGLEIQQTRKVFVEIEHL